MGGPGSGRCRLKTRGTVESFVALDINYLFRHDRFAPQRVQELTWRSREGQPIATITVVMDFDRVWLFYRIRWPERPAELVHEVIALAIPPCPWGAPRPYFRCPTCQRRVIKLHLVGGYFRCR